MKKKRIIEIAATAAVAIAITGWAGGWFDGSDAGKQGGELADPVDVEDVSVPSNEIRESSENLLLQRPNPRTTDFYPSDKTLEGLEIPYYFEDNHATLIGHMGHTLSYNEEDRIPNWVAWELRATELHGNLDRKEGFSPDPAVKGRQAYDSDYKGSGWDRGHMAPSGDMKWSSQALEECYYLSNICPQNHNLNAGLWNDLEKQTRYEAKYYGRVWVVCGPVPNEIGKAVIGRNHVKVPARFFKALLARRKDGTYASVGFIFPNEPGAGRTLKDFAKTVDELEKQIGMDLVYNLDERYQAPAEASFDLYKDWRIRD